MISKAKATKGSVAAIDYIMKEEKQSYELYRNDVIGQNGSEILSEFREVQAMNENCLTIRFPLFLVRIMMLCIIVKNYFVIPKII